MSLPRTNSGGGGGHYQRPRAASASTAGIQGNLHYYHNYSLPRTRGETFFKDGKKIILINTVIVLKFPVDSGLDFSPPSGLRLSSTLPRSAGSSRAGSPLQQQQQQQQQQLYLPPREILIRPVAEEGPHPAFTTTTGLVLTEQQESIVRIIDSMYKLYIRQCYSHKKKRRKKLLYISN